ncbi:SCO family protein [Geopsychrobacter electrodiphilus]|uniref:SCO family protein n=1 Tax=Geopsychrobacter electrodiphilus TaxID=225196 RepID=UPI000377F719|nr:SCO family protein [Geopsychrobacter electrodiphilus]
MGKIRFLKSPIVIVGFCLVIVLGTFFLYLSTLLPPGTEQALNPKGDFTLTESSGKEFHLRDLKGQVVLLFFGYTTCPDACPIALTKISRAMDRLGPGNKNVTTVFVTVDPEQDTPAKLSEYLGFFGVNALGLTGTKAQIDTVVQAYHAYYLKNPGESALGYTISHTVTIYLIDKKGKVRFLFHPEDTAEKMAETITKFL